MWHGLRAFVNRLRANAAVRRKGDVERASQKTPTSLEKDHREWHGVPLDMHVPVPPGSRNPRGQDGRRL